MLDEWAMQSMRDTQDQGFPDLCTILRIQRTNDGFGGVTTEAASVVVDEVPFRATPAQTQFMGGQGDRVLEVEKWTLRFPVGTDLLDEDIVRWTAKGVQLQVEDVKSPKSWETALTAKAEVVRGATWVEE